jgi:hypothetical protein
VAANIAFCSTFSSAISNVSSYCFQSVDGKKGANLVDAELTAKNSGAWAVAGWRVTRSTLDPGKIRVNKAWPPLSFFGRRPSSFSSILFDGGNLSGKFALLNPNARFLPTA